MANAVIAHESDLSGALKASGGLAPKGAPAPRAPNRQFGGDTEHPINPKVIGTAQDAQLNAALDLLGGRTAAR